MMVNLLFCESNLYLQGNREIKSEPERTTFIKLLITQLPHQDPFDPINDTEFIAQWRNFLL